MPALGMAQDTGKVVRWLKRDGEAVSEGEPLLEIETDKATVEVEAPASGTLAAVSAPEGAEIQVGTVIAVVLAPGETVDGSAGEPAAGAEAAADATSGDSLGRAPVVAAPAAARPLVERTPVAAASPAASPRERQRGPRVSPKARRLAEALGVDLATVSGSGPRGAVVGADVERASRAAVTGNGDRFEVGTVWRVMAERTQRSWQEAPQFVLRREVRASRLESWKAAARRRTGCERLTHTDLFVRVCAEALRRHPRVNASWREGAIIPGPGINVAIAIATDDGLVAPVVHHAERLDLAAIAARRTELAEAARARRLRPEDLRDGTFTISNLGMYGVDSFQAIVDSPQAAILAVGRARERPVALDGAVVVRPVVALSVSFDHRVVDGARGAEFLDTIASLLEEPAGLVA